MTVTQHHLAQILGAARLLRFMRAGWLAPAERTPSRILFRISDVRAALRRLERERCPPDRIEIARVRASEARNGHARVRKEKKPSPTVDGIELDFSEFESLGLFRT